MYDIVVIGGGVIGGSILRELTKYELKVCLLEKEDDVCMGQSKANSGIVHAGYDAASGTLKAKFNVQGNQMMRQFAEDLGVKYQNIGSLVVAFSEEDIETLKVLKRRGEVNGVDTEIIDKSRLREIEPNISDNALAALYAPSAGIICPYELTIAAIGNAMDNGARLYTNFNVCKVKKAGGGYELISEDGQCVAGRIVINCAGLGAQRVAELFGDHSVKLKGKAGEYILLDRESAGFVRHTLFFTPTKKGKGILVTQTVDGNILLGPTSELVEDCEPVTSAEGLEAIIEKANAMCRGVPLYNVITSFCGVRACPDGEDFIIGESGEAENYINCVGIESPGLTASPAIAKYVVEELVQKKLGARRKKDFIGKRAPDHLFKEMSVEEKNALIGKNPAYGRIVCRCEAVTEGEIVAAIHKNPPARNIDAVKRRTRSGMGRCQGGFCQPHVAKILARELNIPLEEVTKSGKNSELVVGKTK